MALTRRGEHFHKILRGTVSAAGTVTISDRQPTPDEQITYHRVAVEDETNALTDWRIGIADPFNFYPFHQAVNVAVATLNVYDGEMVVARDDEALQVRVTGGTEGDSMVVYLDYSVMLD